jgi:hypothetical protein
VEKAKDIMINIVNYNILMSNYGEYLKAQDALSRTRLSLPHLKNAFTQSCLISNKRHHVDSLNSSKVKKKTMFISPEEIKQHANLLYDTMKKLDPPANEFSIKTTRLTASIQVPSSNVSAELQDSNDSKQTNECKLDIFEKRFLKLYGISTLYEGIDHLIIKASELCLQKNKLDKGYLLTVKQQSDKQLPNRYELSLLSNWVNSKISSIMASEKNSFLSYKKMVYIYFLAMLEISRQVLISLGLYLMQRKRKFAYFCLV